MAKRKPNNGSNLNNLAVALILQPVELKDDLSNLASFATVEAEELKGKTQEGKPNQAAMVLHGTLTAVMKADAKVEKVCAIYSEAAYAAGLRTSMMPPGAKYLSPKASPEYNLLYLTVATAKYGENCAAV